jgi:phosphohistidine phosphatase
MDVTVIRHGTAEDRAPTDAERALTAVGRAECERAAERLSHLDPSPDSIVSSPYLRARQTAEVVAARVGLGGALELEPALVPDAPPTGVLELLCRLSHRRHVVLVAHEPILSAACELLLGTVVPGLRRAEILSMRNKAGSDVRAKDFAIRFRA